MSRSSGLGHTVQPGGRHRSRRWLIAVAAIAVPALAACSSPGGSAPASSAASSTPSSVSTDVGSTPTTLTLFSAAGLKPYEQGLADAFQKQYPAITVKLQVEADNNYNTVLPRLLASNSTPDIIAPSDLIGEVKDGLLTDLTPYAQAYGWTSKIPASVLAPGRVDNGVIGSGTLYEAGGAAGPLVGVFYNKALAAKIGLTSPPATVADLEKDLAAAKAAGITPIIASNQDGLIGHLYSLLLGDYMGADALNAIVYHHPGATVNTPAAVQATTVLQTWMKDGYFNANANAINQEASYGDFANGQGLFMFQGSWMVQSLPASFSGKYGVFDFPPVQAGGKYTGMSSDTLAYSIAAKSTHKNAAALFLNFLTTPAAAQVAVQNGYAALGVQSTPTPSMSASLTDQIQAGYAQIAADNGFTTWLQNAGPEVNTAETAQLQLLFASKTTPAAMVKALEAAYQTALGQ